MKGESCVICGAPIPEGRQVCLSCDSVHRAPKRLTWSAGGFWGVVGTDVRRVSGALYGALFKLKDYEETGLSPDEVRAMLDEKATK